MKPYKMQALLFWVALHVADWPGMSQLEAATGTLPPLVSIVRPPPPDSLFSVGLMMKIKAEASDPDGSIDRVEFFAGTNMVGVATNPPYNVLWFISDDVRGPWMLKAVAVDNAGARTE